MAGVDSMEEPIGAALAAIAEAIGTSDESLRLLIGILAFFDSHYYARMN